MNTQFCEGFMKSIRELLKADQGKYCSHTMRYKASLKILHTMLLGCKMTNTEAVNHAFVKAMTGFFVHYSELLTRIIKKMVHTVKGWKETLLGLILNVGRFRKEVRKANLLMKVTNRISRRSWTDNVFNVFQKVNKLLGSTLRVIEPSHVIEELFRKQTCSIPVNIFYRFDFKLHDYNSLQTSQYAPFIPSVYVSINDIMLMQLSCPNIRKRMQLLQITKREMCIYGQVCLLKLGTDGFIYNNRRSMIISTLTNVSVIGGELTPSCTDIIQLTTAPENRQNLSLHAQPANWEVMILKYCGILDPHTGGIVMPLIFVCEDTASLEKKLGMNGSAPQTKHCMMLNNFSKDICSKWSRWLVPMSRGHVEHHKLWQKLVRNFQTKPSNAAFKDADEGSMEFFETLTSKKIAGGVVSDSHITVGELSLGFETLHVLLRLTGHITKYVILTIFDYYKWLQEFPEFLLENHDENFAIISEQALAKHFRECCKLYNFSYASGANTRSKCAFDGATCNQLLNDPHRLYDPCDNVHCAYQGLRGSPVLKLFRDLYTMLRATLQPFRILNRAEYDDWFKKNVQASEHIWQKQSYGLVALFDFLCKNRYSRYLHNVTQCSQYFLTIAWRLRATLRCLYSTEPTETQNATVKYISRMISSNYSTIPSDSLRRIVLILLWLRYEHKEFNQYLCCDRICTLIEKHRERARHSPSSQAYAKDLEEAMLTVLQDFEDSVADSANIDVDDDDDDDDGKDDAKSNEFAEEKTEMLEALLTESVLERTEAAEQNDANDDTERPLWVQNNIDLRMIKLRTLDDVELTAWTRDGRPSEALFAVHVDMLLGATSLKLTIHVDREASEKIELIWKYHQLHCIGFFEQMSQDSADSNGLYHQIRVGFALHFCCSPQVIHRRGRKSVNIDRFENFPHYDIVNNSLKFVAEKLFARLKASTVADYEGLLQWHDAIQEWQVNTQAPNHWYENEPASFTESVCAANHRKYIGDKTPLNRKHSEVMLDCSLFLKGQPKFRKCLICGALIPRWDPHPYCFGAGSANLTEKTNHIMQMIYKGECAIQETSYPMHEPWEKDCRLPPSYLQKNPNVIQLALLIHWNCAVWIIEHHLHLQDFVRSPALEASIFVKIVDAALHEINPKFARRFSNREALSAVAKAFGIKQKWWHEWRSGDRDTLMICFKVCWIPSKFLSPNNFVNLMCTHWRSFGH